MIPLLLAQTDGWAVVNALSVLIALGLSSFAFIRQVSGKGNERQIEPTALHAITSELRQQTLTLNSINREVGEVRTTVASLNEQMAGMHHRVGSISRDLAATEARVSGLEKRESSNA